jgi:ribosomal protein S18 acetylase RimI-like enzyme
MPMPAPSPVAPRPVSARAATSDDADRLFEILTLAFAADPAARWMYPDPQQYLHYFPLFAEAFGGGAIAEGTAFVSEGIGGAALWLAPDTAPDDEALGRLLEQSVAASEKADAFAVFEEMAECHPEEPHWYLPLIGVKPASQSTGHGSALMRRALFLCDALGLPAYLEATSARSIPFYRSHGFEIVREIRRGNCPPIVPMLRPAR